MEGINIFPNSQFDVRLYKIVLPSYKNSLTLELLGRLFEQK